jgi:hypothetical protein
MGNDQPFALTRGPTRSPDFTSPSTVIRSSGVREWKTSGPRSQADQRKNTCGGSPAKSSPSRALG